LTGSERSRRGVRPRHSGERWCGQSWSRTVGETSTTAHAQMHQLLGGVQKSVGISSNSDAQMHQLLGGGVQKSVGVSTNSAWHRRG
jgi:hypothetical protein